MPLSITVSNAPIYVKAGAIIPIDPIRQYTSQPVSEPTTLRIYSGANGDFTLYDDDGISQEYLTGKSARIHLRYDNNSKQLTIEPGAGNQQTMQRDFQVQLLPAGTQQQVQYRGRRLVVGL